MSWDAYLCAEVDGHDIEIKSWNYTHNCNRMMATVLEEHGHKLEQHWLIGHMGKSWFDALNGLDGKHGGELLDMIINEMQNDPARFRAMNPENNWGSFRDESAMRDARRVEEIPVRTLAGERIKG